MPAMKVTVSAAMRARDVSRPRDEQVAAAEAAEASIPSVPRANVTAGSGTRGDDERGGELAGDGAEAEMRDGEERGGTRAEPEGRAEGTQADPEGTRRRRMPRDSRRRGRD